METKGNIYGYIRVSSLAQHDDRQRTGQDYINIQIFQNSNLEKTNWENRIGCIDIEACASVSRMGGSPTTEELLKAADEIARGARFTADIQSMGLSYERAF